MARGAPTAEAGRAVAFGVLSMRLCGDAAEDAMEVVFGSPELTVRRPGVEGMPVTPGRLTGDCGRTNTPASPESRLCLDGDFWPTADSGLEDDDGRDEVIGLARLKKLDLRLDTAGEGGMLDRLSTVLSDSEGLGGFLAVRTGDAVTLSERSVDTSLSSGLGPSSYAFSCCEG